MTGLCSSVASSAELQLSTTLELETLVNIFFILTRNAAEASVSCCIQADVSFFFVVFIFFITLLKFRQFLIYLFVIIYIYAHVASLISITTFNINCVTFSHCMWLLSKYLFQIGARFNCKLVFIGTESLTQHLEVFMSPLMGCHWQQI